MKTKILKLIAASLALTAFFSLSSCSKDGNDDGSQQMPQNNAAHTSQCNAKLEYYSALLTELQDELLEEKEKNYLASSGYEARIAELEANLDELSEQLIALSDKPKDDTQELPSASSLSDFTYSVNDGKATIILYKGSDESVAVPESIDGYPVVKIGEGAFRDACVVSVTLPDTVKEIDWFAFSGCVYLKEITIPASVTSVGYGAFDYCTSRPTIICQKGSYIESYAASWGMAFESK